MRLFKSYWKTDEQIFYVVKCHFAGDSVVALQSLWHWHKRTGKMSSQYSAGLPKPWPDKGCMHDIYQTRKRQNMGKTSLPTQQGTGLSRLNESTDHTIRCNLIVWSNDQVVGLHKPNLDFWSGLGNLYKKKLCKYFASVDKRQE